MCKNNITIGILAGGKSRRFCNDKNLEIYNGKTLIQWTISNVRYLGSDIYILSKNDEKYSNLGYPILKDKNDDFTPINGIISIIPYVKEWLLLLASDIPFFTKDILQLLINKKKKGKAVVFSINDKLNPFLALYHKSILNLWKEAKNNTERRLTKILDRIPKIVIPEMEAKAVDFELISFTNINTKEDLLEYERKVHKTL